MAHLGDAMYRNGKKEQALSMILLGVQRINDHAAKIDSFEKNVWISRAYLRLAKLLRQDSLQESQLYLDKSREIIEKDNRLVILKQ